MPYLILIIGLLTGLYVLFRFLTKAKPQQIKTFFRIVIIVIYCAIMLYFALMGRIIVSIALLTLAIPFIISYFKGKITHKNKKQDNNKERNEDDK